jgi:argininosuccinate synthase
MRPDRIVVRFKDAMPVEVKHLDDGTKDHRPGRAARLSQRPRRPHGIGRIDIVENRFVGIKSRGVYETPGGTILHFGAARSRGHRDGPRSARLRDMLSPRFSEIIYNGFWFSPEMDFIEAAFKKSYALIDGEVRLSLFKGNVIVEGRSSPSSLYDQDLSSMDVAGGYDQQDARGFIRVNALRLTAHRLIVEHAEEE